MVETGEIRELSSKTKSIMVHAELSQPQLQWNVSMLLALEAYSVFLDKNLWIDISWNNGCNGDLPSRLPPDKKCPGLRIGLSLPSSAG